MADKFPGCCCGGECAGPSAKGIEVTQPNYGFTPLDALGGSHRRFTRKAVQVEDNRVNVDTPGDPADYHESYYCRLFTDVFCGGFTIEQSGTDHTHTGALSIFTGKTGAVIVATDTTYTVTWDYTTAHTSFNDSIHFYGSVIIAVSEEFTRLDMQNSVLQPLLDSADSGGVELAAVPCDTLRVITWASTGSVSPLSTDAPWPSNNLYGTDIAAAAGIFGHIISFFDVGQSSAAIELGGVYYITMPSGFDAYDVSKLNYYSVSAPCRNDRKWTKGRFTIFTDTVGLTSSICAVGAGTGTVRPPAPLLTYPDQSTLQMERTHIVSGGGISSSPCVCT